MARAMVSARPGDFSNFGSLKSTEIGDAELAELPPGDFSNFGSLKSTEMGKPGGDGVVQRRQISAISAR